MAAGGLTLVRLEDPVAAGSGTGASNSQVNADAKAKPSHKASRTVIGGSTYVSKGSTMVRVTGKTSALKARSTRKCLQMIRGKKSKSKKLTRGKDLCIFFIKFGKCSKLPECPYLNDKSKARHSRHHSRHSHYSHLTHKAVSSSLQFTHKSPGCETADCTTNQNECWCRLRFVRNSCAACAMILSACFPTLYQLTRCLFVDISSLACVTTTAVLICM